MCSCSYGPAYRITTCRGKKERFAGSRYVHVGVLCIRVKGNFNFTSFFPDGFCLAGESDV